MTSPVPGGLNQGLCGRARESRRGDREELTRQVDPILGLRIRWKCGHPSDGKRGGNCAFSNTSSVWRGSSYRSNAIFMKSLAGVAT